MVQDQTVVDGFAKFVAVNESTLRHALVASLGAEVGREAAADAMAWGWEHWERIEGMANPVGYLYVLGRNRGRKMASRRRPLFPTPPEDNGIPWVEPGLPAALASLPERERTIVLMVHGYDMAVREVAELLGISRSTVQTHIERAMRKLRRKLGAGS